MAVCLTAWAVGSRYTSAPISIATARTSGSSQESRLAVEQLRLAASQDLQRQAQMLEQQRVAAEQEAIRQAKEAKRRATLARIEGLESELSLLRRDITATENQQEDHQTRVNDYMMDHKMAIAALAAGVAGAGVAFDGSNEFSEDAKGLGGATAVIAGLWALANYEEVIEVADRMAKASAMQTDYKDRIDRMGQRVATLNSQITQEKRSLD